MTVTVAVATLVMAFCTATTTTVFVKVPGVPQAVKFALAPLGVIVPPPAVTSQKYVTPVAV